jgi:hypothetical protein
MARYKKAPDDLRERCRRVLGDNRKSVVPLRTLLDSVDPTEEKKALSILAAAQNDHQDLGEYEPSRWSSMIDHHE